MRKSTLNLFVSAGIVATVVLAIYIERRLSADTLYGPGTMNECPSDTQAMVATITPEYGYGQESNLMLLSLKNKDGQSLGSGVIELQEYRSAEKKNTVSFQVTQNNAERFYGVYTAKTYDANSADYGIDKEALANNVSSGLIASSLGDTVFGLTGKAFQAGDPSTLDDIQGHREKFALGFRELVGSNNGNISNYAPFAGCTSPSDPSKNLQLTELGIDKAEIIFTDHIITGTVNPIDSSLYGKIKTVDGTVLWEGLKATKRSYVYVSGSKETNTTKMFTDGSWLAAAPRPMGKSIVSVTATLSNSRYDIGYNFDYFFRIKDEKGDVPAKQDETGEDETVYVTIYIPDKGSSNSQSINGGCVTASGAQFASQNKSDSSELIVGTDACRQSSNYTLGAMLHGDFHPGAIATAPHGAAKYDINQNWQVSIPGYNGGAFAPIVDHFGSPSSPSGVLVGAGFPNASAEDNGSTAKRMDLAVENEEQQKAVAAGIKAAGGKELNNGIMEVNAKIRKGDAGGFGTPAFKRTISSSTSSGVDVTVPLKTMDGSFSIHPNVYGFYPNGYQGSNDLISMWDQTTLRGWIPTNAIFPGWADNGDVLPGREVTVQLPKIMDYSPKCSGSDSSGVPGSLCKLRERYGVFLIGQQWLDASVPWNVNFSDPAVYNAVMNNTSGSLYVDLNNRYFFYGKNQVALRPYPQNPSPIFRGPSPDGTWLPEPVATFDVDYSQDLMNTPIKVKIDFSKQTAEWRRMAYNNGFLITRMEVLESSGQNFETGVITFRDTSYDRLDSDGVGNSDSAPVITPPPVSDATPEPESDPTPPVTNPTPPVTNPNPPVTDPNSDCPDGKCPLPTPPVAEPESDCSDGKCNLGSNTSSGQTQSLPVAAPSTPVSQRVEQAIQTAAATITGSSTSAEPVVESVALDIAAQAVSRVNLKLANAQQALAVAKANLATAKSDYAATAGEKYSTRAAAKRKITVANRVVTKANYNVNTLTRQLKQLNTLVAQYRRAVANVDAAVTAYDQAANSSARVKRNKMARLVAAKRIVARQEKQFLRY